MDFGPRFVLSVRMQNVLQARFWYLQSGSIPKPLVDTEICGYPSLHLTVFKNKKVPKPVSYLCMTKLCDFPAFRAIFGLKDPLLDFADVPFSIL